MSYESPLLRNCSGAGPAHGGMQEACAVKVLSVDHFAGVPAKFAIPEELQG